MLRKLEDRGYMKYTQQRYQIIAILVEDVAGRHEVSKVHPAEGEANQYPKLLRKPANREYSNHPQPKSKSNDYLSKSKNLAEDICPAELERAERAIIYPSPEGRSLHESMINAR